MEAKANSTSSSSSGLVIAVVLIVAIVVGYAAMTHKSVASPTETHQSATLSSTVHTGNTGNTVHTGHTMALSSSIYSAPTITADQIDAILTAYHSPAAGTGQYLYNYGVHYGIDPAIPLAFFFHESKFGTAGEARATLALGNERCITDRPCIDQSRGGYAQFNSWEDGYAHWYQLLVGPVYHGDGLDTIQTIIPRYAPTADNNDEQAYMSALVSAVNAWRSGQEVL